MTQNHLAPWLATKTQRRLNPIPLVAKRHKHSDCRQLLSLCDAPIMGLFCGSQKMEQEQMFYCQLMQELHELEETITPAQQEAVEVEVEINQYFGE